MSDHPNAVRQKEWTAVKGETPYAFWRNQWVGYDDVASVKRKAEFVRKEGYGGVMIWSIDMDDFNNVCCQEPFPLLRTVARTLGLRNDAAPSSGSCKQPLPPVTTSTEKSTTDYNFGNFGRGAGLSYPQIFFFA